MNDGSTKRVNQLGTIVRLADGREGTVVFNGLSGVGIKWGRHDPDPSVFENSHGDVGSIGIKVEPCPSELAAWTPDAMLRNPWPNATIDCVGEEYTIIRYGLDEWADEAGEA